jgi:hypothetical protein
MHPRITQEEIERLDLTGFGVAPDNIAQLVPLSKFYIASSSATIRLAINCGIPVVNYDVYQYDYDDYKHVPGVLLIKTQADYADAVHGLGSSDAQYDELRNAQTLFAREQTLIDGNAGARLLQLLDRISQARGASA